MNRILPLGLAAVLMSGLGLTAYAQTAPLTQSEADAQAEAEENAKRAQAQKDAAAKAPPAAVPGAVAPEPAAPADKLTSEMSPNDALFDAINRGDQSAARDALNRGAQLDSHNVLGQTPIDASIDLNRTDITFLLLSMRGAVSAPSLHPAVQQAGLPAAAVRHRVRHGVVAVASAQPVARPLGQDRGTPNPAVGFIGY